MTNWRVFRIVALPHLSTLSRARSRTEILWKFFDLAQAKLFFCRVRKHTHSSGAHVECKIVQICVIESIECCLQKLCSRDSIKFHIFTYIYLQMKFISSSVHSNVWLQRTNVIASCWRIVGRNRTRAQATHTHTHASHRGHCGVKVAQSEISLHCIYSNFNQCLQEIYV